MARYGKGLSTNASIVNLGIDKPKDLVPPGMGKAASATSMVNWLAMAKLGDGKPKQSLIRASAGFEGGMKGLVERAKEHNVGQWGHEAFGDNYYNDLKSDRGIAAYLVSQARDGKYDPRVWQAERADLRSQLDNAGSKSDIKEEIKKPESALERLQSAEREEALSKVAGFEDDRDADGGVEIFNGEWDPNRKYTTDTGRGKSFLDSYSANLKKGIKDVKRQLA